MKRLMVVALAAALFTMVGCQKKAADSTTDPKMMAQDDCPHCPGVQKANADGTCPVCNQPVKDPKMMSADACAHCPGIQTANAEGKCPICSEKEKAAAQPAQ
jgi:hypothetical protein